MHDIVALVVDIGLGASALYLARSLNRTVKSLTEIVKSHGERLTALETMK
jgi:hypothetical protein